MANPLKAAAKAVADALKPSELAATPVEPAPVQAEPEQQAQPKKDDGPREPIRVDPMANPRNRALADVVERRNAELIAETGIQPAPDAEVMEPDPEQASEPEYVEPGAPAETPALPAEQPPAAPAQAAEPAPAGVPNIDPEAEYTFIVDGQPVKLKGSQVVARVQKNESADYKLELASRTLRLAEERLAQPPAPGAAQPAQPAAAPLAGKSDAELAQEIQFGTAEQAAGVIAEIRRESAAALAEVQKIARHAPAVVNDQLDVREAATLARTEYADLLGDPYLEPAFKAKLLELRQAGDQRSRSDLVRHVGDEIRKHFNRPKPGTAPIQPQTPQAPSIEQRREAKAAAPAAPRLASARLDGAEKPTLTPEQARQKGIEAMRQRTRGHRPRPS